MGSQGVYSWQRISDDVRVIHWYAKTIRIYCQLSVLPAWCSQPTSCNKLVISSSCNESVTQEKTKKAVSGYVRMAGPWRQLLTIALLEVVNRLVASCFNKL